MLDISKIPPHILKNILDTFPERFTKNDKELGVKAMSVHDAMDAYLSWNGIIGFTNGIMDAHNAIVEAQTAIPGQWTGLINTIVNRHCANWDGIASVDLDTAQEIINDFLKISFKVQYTGFASAKVAQYSDFQRGLIFGWNLENQKVSIILYENP